MASEAPSHGCHGEPASSQNKGLGGGVARVRGGVGGGGVHLVGY